MTKDKDKEKDKAAPAVSDAADDVAEDVQDIGEAVTESVEGDEGPKAETGQEGTSEAGGEVTASSLVGELRAFGEHLAAAVRAAAETDEVGALKDDFRRGVQELRHEIDYAMDTERVSEAKQKVVGEAREKASTVDSTTIRAELATALRMMNKALDKLADSMEPAAGKVVDVASGATSKAAGAVGQAADAVAASDEKDAGEKGGEGDQPAEDESAEGAEAPSDAE
jgi:hypothetical protein